MFADSATSVSYWYDALHKATLSGGFQVRNDDFEAPEMVAAIERNNVQVFSAWERPWLSRTEIYVPYMRVEAEFVVLLTLALLGIVFDWLFRWAICTFAHRCSAVA